MSDNDRPILKRIKEIYPDLSRGQRRIANCILKDPDKVLKSSISEMAANAELKSEASVVKFYRQLGFSGFKEFKIRFAQELSGRTFYHSYGDITFDDSENEIKNKVFSGAINTLTSNMDIDNGSINTAVDLLMNAKRIIFLGYASSAAICYYAHFRFTELGLNCHFTSDSHINAALLAHPLPGDLIFCVSYSGETNDHVRLLQPLSSFDVKILLLTGKHVSTISRMATATLVTKSEENNILTDAMNSRIAELCLIDVLFSIIGIKKGEEGISRLVSTRQIFSEYKYKKK